jgi:hypothetical protein
MLKSRLSGGDHHVDETRGKHAAATVHDLGVADCARRDVAAQIGNAVVDDQKPAELV